MTSPPSTPTPPGALGHRVASPIPVIVHLTGRRRGTTQRLWGDSLRIGTAADAEIRVSPEPSVGEHHATLHRRGPTYELIAEPERPVWVNGSPAAARMLVSGDTLEVGRDGPVVRFRLYPPGKRASKSVGEAFSDCLDCARYGADSPFGRAALLVSGVPRELATQTSPPVRALLALVLLLVLVTGFLGWRSLVLERRLEREVMRVRGISELLDGSADRGYGPEELSSMRAEVSAALERVEALEARTGAPARVLSTATRSVVFLQGAYGFIDPDSGLPLRFLALGSDGKPLTNDRGDPLVGIGGDGPVLEAFFTGTAFVATADGLLLTNRHVALPWAYDEAARMIASQGLRPVMRRFLGYLPEVAHPFPVELELPGDQADLAVLRCREVAGGVAPLPLRDRAPGQGEEVLVLGYPTGIQALLARADERFIERLMADRSLGFWEVARQLAEGGFIAPLASRGIVAQVTPAAVVYDAETTRGGSGGPVLDLEGRVVAVTSAIVGDFGGSNLGVPAPRARGLLARVLFARLLPIPTR